MTDRDIGALQAKVDYLGEEVDDLKLEVKNLNAQLNTGAGGLRVLMWAGTITTTLLVGAAWIGQYLRPFQ